MKIAELFVNLGVKGGDESSKSVDSVKGKLGEARSMGLATKAAIAGAILGVAKLSAESNKAGKDLRQFTDVTGISNQVLQRWQYAGTQIGATNQEVENSFKSVQSAMLDLLMGGQGPEFFGLISESVGLDPSKLRDTEYVLKKLQEFAKQAPPELATKALGSFGLSESIIAGMRRNAFNADVMRNASIIYTEQEVKNLDRLNAKWANFFDTVQKMAGRFNAEFGDYFIDGLTKVTGMIVKLVKELTVLSKNVQLFDKVETALKGATRIAEIATGFTGDDEKAMTKAKRDTVGFFSWIKDALLSEEHSLQGEKIMRRRFAEFQRQNAQNNNITVNQNFSGETSPSQVSRGTRDGIGKAFNQIGNRSLAN